MPAAMQESHWCCSTPSSEPSSSDLSASEPLGDTLCMVERVEAGEDAGLGGSSPASRYQIASSRDTPGGGT